VLRLVLFTQKQLLLNSTKSAVKTVHLHRFDQFNNATVHAINRCDNRFNFPGFHALSLNFDLIIAPAANVLDD
jgi:hypothetical protein